MKEKLYVPLMNSAVRDDTREGYFSELARLHVNTVFLAFDRAAFFSRGEKRAEYVRALAENISAFEGRGYNVGVWIQAFGFGDILCGESWKRAEKYTRLRSVTGKEIPDSDMFCPENECFVSDYLDWVRDIIGSGCKMLMLDDDLCLSVRPGLGCFCDKHIKLLEDELGESLQGRDLQSLFFVGGKSRYRDAYLSVMADTHRRFARSVRRAVDAIDPHVRVGFCAGYTSWDIEGISADKLTRILAGETKPFLRFTGAPYWAAKDIDRFDGMPLGAIIEEARAEEAYCRDSGIEIFFENDSYPRPRYTVPSSILECFSLPMYASGGVGELGYFFDYHSTPDYERGYVKHRLYNKPLYDFIDKNFNDKKPSGVRVYHEMRKLSLSEFSAESTERTVMRAHFNRGAELLSVHGIPTLYGDGSAAGIAFGEEARYVDKLPLRLVTDIKGAAILAEKGIDVGFTEVEKTRSPAFEYFGDEKILLSFMAAGDYYRAALKESAEIVSEFQCADGRFPSAYRYASGECELLVYTFDVGTVSHKSGALRSYARGTQLAEFLGGYPRIDKCVGLYQIFKQGDREDVCLFVNISDDPIIDGEVALPAEYLSAELCGVSGELVGNRLVMSTALPPYGAFAVRLQKR